MYLRAINPAAALLAMKVPNRHVRIAFDREDEFLSCAGRLPTRTTIKTGVKKDGTLVARQSTIYWEKGAYADIGAVIVRNASYCSLGPYRIPTRASTATSSTPTGSPAAASAASASRRCRGRASSRWTAWRASSG